MARSAHARRLADPDGGAEPAMLDSHCGQHIARFKRPKQYVFIDALPKNNYGKVLKTELRERLRARDV
jgi:acyl-CoA synthetase (AMP-forming)/AMP-acid ligase II